MHRVAVIGSGIAGLSAAWRLRAEAHLTLFEAGSHFGGHAHTVDLCLDGITVGVDTGFLVFNPRTYPLLVQLFGELGVETAASDMSFSVQVPQGSRPPLEWSGHSLNTVFAQRRNLLRPRFWHMLKEILRFNRLATRLAQQGGADEVLSQSIGAFLDRHRFGAAFREDYLLPMIACIWSCPTEQMQQYPVATLIRFCHNHGLLQVRDRPQWYTVRGGSRRYVERMIQSLGDTRLRTPVQSVRRTGGGILVQTPQGTESFDAVVMACHTQDALALLGTQARPEERAILGAIRYQPNTAVLHTDARVLPRNPAAWAAWNYERAGDPSREGSRVCLHYLINRLQPLPWQQPVIVSLNPVRPIDAAHVRQRIEYAHPVFDLAALQAQQRIHSLQGQDRIWYCGAWCGHGFHEDGLRSGIAAAEGVRAALGQWRHTAQEAA